MRKGYLVVAAVFAAAAALGAFVTTQNSRTSATPTCSNIVYRVWAATPRGATPTPPVASGTPCPESNDPEGDPRAAVLDRPSYNADTIPLWRGDVNNDGYITQADYILVTRLFFMQTAPGSVPTAAPSPSPTGTPSVRCDLSGRSFFNGQLRDNNYDDCLFIATQARGAHFDNSSLRRTDFTNANLQNACLCNVDLTDADLTNADLSGTWIFDSNLLDAITTGVVFDSTPGYTTLWSNSICPDGTNSDNNGDSCVGHGFDGDPLPTFTPTATAPACSNPSFAGTVGWWPVNGNGDDASPNNNDATLGNGLAFSDGLFGLGMNLDGQDDHLRVGSPAVLNTFPNGLTLEAWVNVASVPPPPDGSMSGMYSVITKWGQGGGVDAYGLYVANIDGDIRLVGPLATDGGSDGVDFRGGSIPLGAWTHVAMTWDTGTQKLWVNGANVASRIRTGTIVQSGVSVLVGGEESTSPRPFHGQIDEPRIYNRALSEPELAEVYSAGAGGGCP
jgi:hypothetical protein